MNDEILDATHIDLTSAHPDLIHLLKQIATGKPIILHQHGKQVAALMSIEDLHLLERLIEEEEDRIDVADAQAILAQTKEEDWIPLEQVKAELGLL